MRRYPAGLEDELALGVWREALVQEEDPWAGWIPGTSSYSSYSSVSDVAHLDAEGEFMTWEGSKVADVT